MGEVEAQAEGLAVRCAEARACSAAVEGVRTKSRAAAEARGGRWAVALRWRVLQRST